MPNYSTLNHGTIQAFQVPCRDLQPVSACGNASSMFAHSIRIDEHLPKELCDLFHQHHYREGHPKHGKSRKIYMTKSPDGYICTDKERNILAAMHAPGLHGAGEVRLKF